ncbi:MAG TPA: hypothetical protein VFW62_00760, partial [bacterium]|nr:hypothetical protein [bacterium]
REAIAKAALRATARQVSRKLIQIIDPRVTVQEHPWKSSGIAALAGFFIGFKVTSPAGENPSGGQQPAAGPSAWDALTSTLIETGSGAVKSALMPWLAGKIQEWMPKSENPAEATEVKPEEVPFSP